MKSAALVFGVIVLLLLTALYYLGIAYVVVHFVAKFW